MNVLPSSMDAPSSLAIAFAVAHAPVSFRPYGAEPRRIVVDVLWRIPGAVDRGCPSGDAPKRSRVVGRPGADASVRLRVGGLPMPPRRIQVVLDRPADRFAALHERIVANRLARPDAIATPAAVPLRAGGLPLPLPRTTKARTVDPSRDPRCDPPEQVE